MKSYANLIEMIGDGFVAIEKDKILNLVNNTMRDWFGFGTEVRTFDWLLTHFDEKDQVAVRNVYTLSLSSDKPFKVNQIVRGTLSTGEKRYFRISFFKIENDRVAFVLRDVTIEITDDAREQLSNNIFDSLPIGVVLVNKDHKVLKINKTARDAYDIPPFRIENTYLGDFIKCENAETKQCGQSDYCETCSINQALKSIEYGMYNHQMVTATKRTSSGDLRTFKVTISRSLNEDNVEMLLTLQDITDQINYEKSLKEAHDQAKEANALKTAFLSNMSHEIRTPLNGIIGMIDLSKRLAKGEELLENLSIAKESSLNLLRIINSVLDLSKMEAGLFEIHKMPFNTDDFIGEIINENKFKIKSERVDLIRNYEADSVVISDRLRLKQVINNLLDNAIKFTDKGYIKIQYHVVPKDDVATFAVNIIDTGIGITDDFKEKMFQNFMQADGSFTRQKGGSGLGLSISHRIIEKLGGQLQYRKNAQGGSEFYFAIPVEILKGVSGQSRHEEIIENMGLNVEKPLETQKKTILKNIRILLVEDDIVNQKVISKKLNLDGYEVMIASNGSEAIRALEQDNKIELVIMDIQMPVMNGLEAIEIIRNQDRFSKLPIIALTALALPEEKVQIEKYGFSDYISKPVQLDVLSDKIGQFFTEKPPRSYTDLRSEVLNLLNAGGIAMEEGLDEELTEMCQILEGVGLTELKTQVFMLQLEFRKEFSEEFITKLYDILDTLDQVMVI